MKEQLLNRVVKDDLNVECSIAFPNSNELDALIAESKANIDKYEKGIQKNTFNGDNIDLLVAAGSGFLCGVLDAICLSNIDLTKCKDIGEKTLEPIIKIMGGSKDISKAVIKLEEKTKQSFASDPNLIYYGGGLQHHLRDYAHHLSPMGLFFSILTQFTGKCYGADVTGRLLITEVVDKSRIGSSISQKLSFGFVDWFFHLASDLNGSRKTVGRGTGIPGPLLSLAKELSTILPKNEKDKKSLISQMFHGTLFSERDALGNKIRGTEKPLDFRAELGMSILQNIPVLLNAICVKGFYFVRRIIIEAKNKRLDSHYSINWKNTLPIGNTTIVRMNTVANATFSAVDLAAATITSAAKSGGTIPGFVANMVLNVNFVGLGKTCISFGQETVIGFKKYCFERKKTIEIIKLMHLYESKLYVYQDNLWNEVKETEIALGQLEQVCNNTSNDLANYIVNMQSNLEDIEEGLKDNKALKDYLKDELES